MSQFFANLGRFFSSAPFIHGLLVAACILIALLGLAIWLLVVYRGWRWLQKRQQIDLPVYLQNQSNLDAPFQLNARFGAAEKKFSHFWLDEDQRLAFKPVEKTKWVEEQPQTARTDVKKSGAKRRGAALEAKVKKNLSLFHALTGSLAAISSALATILPDAIKGPFQDAAASIRDAQTTANEAVERPRQLASSGEQLSSGVKRLKATTGVKTSSTAAGVEGTTRPRFTQVVTEVFQVAETVALGPMENRRLHLMVRPRNPLKAASAQLEIESQQMEAPDFPPFEPLPAQTISKEVDIPRAPVQPQLMFFGACLVAAGLCAWGAAALVNLFVRLM